MSSAIHDAVAVRNDFVEAFAEMYAELDGREPSVGALCERAGYSRSTFYRQFDSMDEVLDAWEDSVVPYDAMHALLDNAETIGMREITDAFLSSLIARKEPFRILFEHDEKSRFFRKCKDAMRPVFRSQAVRVYNMTSFEYDVFAEYLTNAKLSLLRMWALSPADLDLAHMTKVTDSTLEGALWDRVEEAARCREEGRPFEKISMDDLAATRPWIAYRY